MKQVEQRRVVPASVILVVLFSVLGLLQISVIAGGLEIRSVWIRRYLPFAYEPFQWVVGEHPHSKHILESAKQTRVVEDADYATIAGFSPDELDVSLESAFEMPSTNFIIEPTVPVPVSEPDTPKEDPEGDIPVG